MKIDELQYKTHSQKPQVPFQGAFNIEKVTKALRLGGIFWNFWAVLLNKVEIKFIARLKKSLAAVVLNLDWNYIISITRS